MVPPFQEVIKQINTFVRQVRFDSELGSGLRFFPDFLFSMQAFLHLILGYFPPRSPPCSAAVSAVNSICLPCGVLLVELLGTNLKPLTPRLQIVSWIPQHKGCHFLPQKQRKNLVSSRPQETCLPSPCKCAWLCSTQSSSQNGRQLTDSISIQSLFSGQNNRYLMDKELHVLEGRWDKS